MLQLSQPSLASTLLLSRSSRSVASTLPPLSTSLAFICCHPLLLLRCYPTLAFKLPPYSILSRFYVIAPSTTLASMLLPLSTILSLLRCCPLHHSRFYAADFSITLASTLLLCGLSTRSTSASIHCHSLNQPSLASTVPRSQPLSPLRWCHPLNALSVVKRIEENQKQQPATVEQHQSTIANQTVVTHAVNFKLGSNFWSQTIFYTFNRDRLAPLSIVIQSHNQHFGKEGRASTLALLLAGTRVSFFSEIGQDSTHSKRPTMGPPLSMVYH